VKKLLLLALLFLVACTGTSEPPLNLLLAVGDGNRVVFYPSGPDAAVAVGSWDLGEAVADLVRLEGESRLWVLTPQALRAYPLSGGALDQAPAQPAALVTLDLDPGVDCGQGSLLPGNDELLLDCGGGKVWTVPLANPALTPVDTSADGPSTLYLLGPEDLLTKLTPTAGGFELRYPGPGEDYHYSVATAEPSGLSAAWSSEGVLAIAVDDGQNTTLYTWTAASGDPPKPSGDPLTLSGVRFVLPLAEGWLLGGEQGYALRRPDKPDVVRQKPASCGLVDPNLYAYLGAPGRLVVLDLLDPALGEHERAFAAAPRGLVYLPVGQ